MGQNITDADIILYDNIANVKVPYKINFAEQLTNYGITFFELTKQNDDWKIVYMIDSGANEHDPFKN